MIIIARKSKRDQIARNFLLVHEDKVEGIYQTAIYVRLSKEENNDNTNQSIDNQKFMLKQYVERNSDLELKAIYVDNGKTGTNFTRPAFIRMMEEIQKGNINCVVVKDLSRLGRNYIDAGKYIENIFPLFDVRFISVNDQYDSINRQENDSIELSVKNLINEAYAKDISKKIRASFERKKKEGEYLASTPPFGYLRGKNHDNHLYKDEIAANIVRNIFKERANGKSYTQIANELNNKNITPPNLYKFQKGIVKDTQNVSKYWGPKAVKDITNNQVYLGNIVHNRSKQILGDRKRQCNRDDFFIVERTHEAIISKSLFDTVSRINNQTKNRNRLNEGD